MDAASRTVLSESEIEACTAHGITPHKFLVARGASQQGDTVHHWNAPTEDDIARTTKPLPRGKIP
jgi:hypothetical protein